MLPFYRKPVNANQRKEAILETTPSSAEQIAPPGGQSMTAPSAESEQPTVAEVMKADDEGGLAG